MKPGSENADERSGESPDERYEEFAKKNGAGHREVEEALRDLDEIANGADPSKREEEAGV